MVIGNQSRVDPIYNTLSPPTTLSQGQLLALDSIEKNILPQSNLLKMSSSDCLPDYPLNSDLVKRLKSSLEARDEKAVLDLICTEVKHVNAIIELANDDWMKEPDEPLHPLVLVGLWSLEYKRELTNPLCITAGHGHADCVRHLLRRDADVNAAPGGKSALHEACRGGHTACAELLLEHRADPDLPSEEGLAPLHLCTSPNTLGCAQVLVKHGALVNQASSEGRESPLHVAAKHGLRDHTLLYLQHGASVDNRNSREETPLSVACGRAREPYEQERYLEVCRLLLRHGADANATDEEEKSPLHKACKNASYLLVQLLLQNQAKVNVFDYNGTSPMACVLQSASFKRECRPHRTVQMLLNHGSQRIWPGAFEKVLKSCASTPEVIGILFNSYSKLRVSEKWREVIPEDVFQMHQPFYQSLFMLSHTPRCLQHLCRCAVRKHLGSKCWSCIPQLPVPEPLKHYLLLEPEGLLL
ncbi:ankyrin repeat and SOCS box protein 18 isoform X1 [Antechinus flavipes]|uniref:ankyrin repeat and SOCS box protein 18 isoform X1 n=1 Tax=Antechinus flavipes TaxID=38775 RepID=UPI002235459F|nr:ankyrin repeat and SOCS box protein 18 isoform X1 [Antechinus flavipes]